MVREKWEKVVLAKLVCAWGQVGLVCLGGVQMVTRGDGRAARFGSARRLADGLARCWDIWASFLELCD
ncbi:hypothetical protein TIFTF001_029224 [Ficus carica]|uniref:Uncharacterized protein n=1 Tax=Ficus carica TaxID=3494 RepID=A0AA88J339_FICCA|nr:hypothetical protein TIFTF001_029224 [Ficus carica]